VLEAAERPFDLVITDLIMPGKEGIETVQELREQNPATHGSSRSPGRHVRRSRSSIADAELFGADASLSKPFSNEALRTTVRRVIGTAV